MRRFLRLKAILLLLFVAWSTAMVVPSLAEIAEHELPAWWTETFTRKFKLGLDLQGGLHLEYSVAVDEAIETKLDQVASELESAFREKKGVEVKIERQGIDRMSIRFPKPEDVALATDDVMGVSYGIVTRVEPLEGEEGEAQGVLRYRMPEEALAENRKAAVAQALETVRRRVDAMGVAEPNIYPKNRQIVVELPGLSDTATELKAAADDAARSVEEILKSQGVEQVLIGGVRGEPGAFRLTLPGEDAVAKFEAAFAGKFAESTLVDDRVGVDLERREVEGGQASDRESLLLALTERARDKVLEESGDFRRLLKIIERQAVLRMQLVDDSTPFGETGKPYLRALYEANMVTEGMGISVNMESSYGGDRPGGSETKEPFVFYAKDRRTLEQFFDSLPAAWRLPKTHMIAFGQDSIVTRRGAPPEALWRTFVLRSRAEVTGDRIVSAAVQPDPQTQVPGVSVDFDKMGGDLVEKMSRENIGRKMAIVLDDVVASDPVFNEAIPGGRVRITLGNIPGQSVRDQANDLVKVLKSGSLPARLQKEFEIRVGADLGRDSVERGFRAFALGLILVALFMAVYYRGAGVIAVIALVLNMLLILAAMSFFRATLTLPGIAGIVLTIGMAVDANVIIFERIRDYLREGYTARAAIESGYDRAFTTILDAQLTTAIAGLVLAQYGSGPIRGFALTLLIGIATSIFTGVFCTRLFFDFQSNRRGYKKVSI